MSRPLQHGLSFLPDLRAGHDASAADYFDLVLALSALADEAGLSHVKMTEHYLDPYGGYCPSPLAFLAAVASRTSRVRLMTGCLLPAFHHPVQLAAETAMVDALSRGRLDVGVARAYLPYEFDALGIDLDTSRDRFDATVDAVTRLWSGRPCTEDTPFFAFSDAVSQPPPTQPGGPPIWVAAVMTPQSFVDAGRKGRGLLVTPSISPMTRMSELVASYRDAFVPARPGDRSRVLASLPLHVGPSDEAACRVADPRLQHYLDVWGAAARAWSTRSSRDYRGYTGIVRAIAATTPASMRSVGGAVVGSAATVVERIGQLQDVLDVDGFLWQVDFGAVDPTTARDGVDRFLADVLPHVQDVPSPREGAAP